jgi:ATP phosphoribosyltransferase regulatory subunit
VAERAGSTERVEKRYRELGSIRIATKYPNITRAHFGKVGMQVEIVKLHGNIELGPITGMAELIVDITATGTTLRENDLVVVDEVLASTARFFANPCSFRTNPRVGQLADALSANVKED